MSVVGGAVRASSIREERCGSGRGEESDLREDRSGGRGFGPGHAAREILSIAEAEGAGRIAMGSRGLGDWSSLLVEA